MLLRLPLPRGEETKRAAATALLLLLLLLSLFFFFLFRLRSHLLRSSPCRSPPAPRRGFPGLRVSDLSNTMLMMAMVTK